MADIDKPKVMNRTASDAIAEVERRRAEEEEAALQAQSELYGDVHAVREGEEERDRSRKSKSKGKKKSKKKSGSSSSSKKGKKQKGGVSNHLVEKQLEYKRARREWRNHKARQQVGSTAVVAPSDVLFLHVLVLVFPLYSFSCSCSGSCCSGSGSCSGSCFFHSSAGGCCGVAGG